MLPKPLMEHLEKCLSQGHLSHFSPEIAGEILSGYIDSALAAALRFQNIACIAQAANQSAVWAPLPLTMRTMGASIFQDTTNKNTVKMLK